MPGPMRKIRGLRDIKTHAGRAEATRLPHQALLRVAWLEMEKHRRKSEKESAMHRVRSIDRRLKEIEAEQANLMEKVELGKQSGNCDSDQGCENKDQDSKGSGFKIHY